MENIRKLNTEELTKLKSIVCETMQAISEPFRLEVGAQENLDLQQACTPSFIENFLGLFDFIPLTRNETTADGLLKYLMTIFTHYIETIQVKRVGTKPLTTIEIKHRVATPALQTVNTFLNYLYDTPHPQIYIKEVATPSSQLPPADLLFKATSALPSLESTLARSYQQTGKLIEHTNTPVQPAAQTSGPTEGRKNEAIESVASQPVTSLLPALKDSHERSAPVSPGHLEQTAPGSPPAPVAQPSEPAPISKTPAPRWGGSLLKPRLTGSLSKSPPQVKEVTAAPPVEHSSASSPPPEAKSPAIETAPAPESSGLAAQLSTDALRSGISSAHQLGPAVGPTTPIPVSDKEIVLLLKQIQDQILLALQFAALRRHLSIEQESIPDLIQKLYIADKRLEHQLELIHRLFVFTEKLLSQEDLAIADYRRLLLGYSALYQNGGILH